MNSLKERNTLVEENMGLVYMVAKKFTGRGVEFEDIVQIGTIGLIKAGERFDKNLNIKFSTYAVTMVMGEIKRFFRDDGLLKIPRSVKELGGKIIKATEQFKKISNREPTVKELAQYLEIDIEKIIEAIDAMKPCESLCVENDTGLSLDEKLVSESSENLDIENKILLKELLGCLDGRLRKILFFRYFMDKTQSEIAKILSISQVQVSRLEKRALEIMKSKCKTSINKNS